jgi:hypothetical protein
MSMKLGDARALIATIRFDVKAGNIERARRWANEAIEGRWDEASPAQLEHACKAIEAKLEEMGL